MSKITDIDRVPSTPVVSRTSGTVGTLENLAGFVEDMNSQAMDRLADPAVLEAVVKQRFGPNVTVADVTEALTALRALSTGI